MKKFTTIFVIICVICATSLILTSCNKNKCADGHTWELSSTTATCYDGGVETYKCKKCKSTKTENVEAYGHDLVQSSYTAPTCKTTGESVDKCSRCGFESKTTLLVIDHDYKVKSTTPSTCTVKGSQTLECSMCHETKTETLELKEHDYRLTNTTPSTCVTHGKNYFKCKDCTAEKSEELPFAEHKYETKTVESTCFTHGGEKEICKVCQDMKSTTETPLLSHNWGADGYCTHCGIYETLFDIDKLNVTWTKNGELGTIRGNLTTKFNETTKSIPLSYWKDHVVMLTITLFDKNGNSFGSHDFLSSTLDSGELIIRHINYVQANKFSIFLGEYDKYTTEQLKICTSFKIELSCDGYKTIEKTYQLTEDTNF